jgi:hypothetical protein
VEKRTFLDDFYREKEEKKRKKEVEMQDQIPHDIERNRENEKETFSQ